MTIRTIALLLVSIPLSGCTFPVNFYIRNLTSEQIIVKVSLHNKASSPEVTYTDDTVSLSYDLHEKFIDTLRPQKVEDEYLYYGLPAHSTFFVGEGANYRNFTFDKIEVFHNHKEQVILDWENQHFFKKAKSFPNKHFAWYDIN